VMDVWMDSGVMHHCLSQIRPEATVPADLYLEGSDQHRGWFHSSLLTSIALHGRAPYRAVLTHGFTVDEKGRKMSKSLGNVILPQAVMKNLGADVLRLWVSATDYSKEITVSDEILKRIADSYRRIRNTLRFLLGGLHGFDTARHPVLWDEMISLDRWAVSRAFAVQNEVVTAYRNYELHDIYQKIHNFCVVDLSGIYLDIIKDRLYTTGKDSRPRHSAQTAMFHILQAMVRWIAPVLSFTAEEAWKYMPGTANASVFLNEWHQFPAGAERPNEIDWEAVIALKQQVAGELEQVRAAGTIGAPLEAEVTVHVTEDQAKKFAPLGDELRFVLITSQARLAPRAAAGPAEEPIKVEVARSSAPKCIRCWHLRSDVGSNPTHPELCARCVTNVDGPGEERHFA
jgi:isoleucyl-tRNA synthetase